jgi:hypothetical protein
MAEEDHPVPLLSMLWFVDQARGCDQALLTQTKTDFESSHAAADVKFRRLVGSLAESCEFSPGLSSTLTALTGADIPMRPGMEKKVVTSDAAAWSAACPGGSAAFDAAYAATGDAREAALFGPCDVARYRFAAPGELAHATGVVFVALLVAKQFELQQVPDAVAIPLERYLAGLGAAPATPAAPDPWTTARTAVDAVSTKPYSALPPDQWATQAQTLLGLCETLRARPTTERQKNRPLEFDTCAQAGRAADASGQQTAPQFSTVAGKSVNRGYYLAGATAKADSTLVDFCKDAEVKSAVGWYVQQLQSGALPSP